MADQAPPVHPVPDTAPPKQNDGHLMMLNMARGGMIHRPETALRIAELLLEEHYDAKELTRQRPLQVIDLGDRWRIEGSLNRDRKEDGRGPFYVEMWKYDGRIIDLNVPLIVHPPEWVARVARTPSR